MIGSVTYLPFASATVNDGFCENPVLVIITIVQLAASSTSQSPWFPVNNDNGRARRLGNLGVRIAAAQHLAF